MRVSEAKSQVIELASADIEEKRLSNPINPNPPPSLSDKGKFTILGKPARAIHRFNGWNVPINLSWFEDQFDQPTINNEEFYWYAFAIPKYAGYTRRHYYICDYLQMRDWVLDFSEPLGIDHQDHSYWRADIRPYGAYPDETLGYFRWGDEPIDAQDDSDRVIHLDNIAEIIWRHRTSKRYSAIAESKAHLDLKLFVAQNPELVGLTNEFNPILEYIFPTGDHVDVLFDGPDGCRAVVEVEIHDETNLIIGVYQAIKYRTLAAIEHDLPINSPKVKAILVAYEIDYSGVRTVAKDYGVKVFALKPKNHLSY